MNPNSKLMFFDLPGRYRICVLGQFSAGWAGRLEDMAICEQQLTNQQPITTLTGEVRDQTALMGVLNTLYDMGYPLLQVERLGA